MNIVRTLLTITALGFTACVGKANMQVESPVSSLAAYKTAAVETEIINAGTDDVAKDVHDRVVARLKERKTFATVADAPTGGEGELLVHVKVERVKRVNGVAAGMLTNQRSDPAETGLKIDLIDSASKKSLGAAKVDAKSTTTGTLAQGEANEAAAVQIVYLIETSMK